MRIKHMSYEELGAIGARADEYLELKKAAGEWLQGFYEEERE